jgi:hypothetical protein
MIDILKLYIENLTPFTSDQGTNKEDRIVLTKISYQIADTILFYHKKQHLYDQHSLKYLQNSIFSTIITLF